MLCETYLSFKKTLIDFQCRHYNSNVPVAVVRRGQKVKDGVKSSTHKMASVRLDSLVYHLLLADEVQNVCEPI